MSIRWEIYDGLEKFWLFEAACLWLEIDPSENSIESPSVPVRRMMSMIEDDCFVYYPGTHKSSIKFIREGNSPICTQHIEIPDWGYSSIEVENKIPVVGRDNLIRMAKQLQQAPKFLFPEARKESTLEDKPLATKKRNSYLKLIKGLLHKQGVDPSERAIAKILMGYVKDSGFTLGKDAMGDILKELQELEPDR